MKQVIEQFFGPVATEVKWHLERWLVTLLGNWSHPFNGIRIKNPPHPGHLYRDDLRLEDGSDPRWIEVFVHDESDDFCVYVTTRHADNFTNACADGIAKTLASGWAGTVDR